MNIGIIGGGAIGLLCASYLSQHHDITVLTRRKEQARFEHQVLSERSRRLWEHSERFSNKVVRVP
ncbi:hypothetical protein BSAF29S_05212 [Bacillus safensis subsp. safensis]